MKKSLILTSLSTISILLATGCSHQQEMHAGHGHGAAMSGDHGSAWQSVNQLVAVVHPTQGNSCSGTVRFVEQNGKVRVIADLSGLKPNQKHAMHIHEFGDCTAPDGTSAGGHYNPEGHDHALPDMSMRHAGDLGNVQADASGKAHYELTVDNVTLAGLQNPIIGRGVIVHAQPDDGGQPVGNAGARIGCGVIGIAKK
jgi:Cu-Zn family superoxide dismutase